MSGEELREALEAEINRLYEWAVGAVQNDAQATVDILVEKISDLRHAALAAPSTPEPSGECRDSDMARQFGVYDSEQLPTCNFDCDACRAESQP